MYDGMTGRFAPSRYASLRSVRAYDKDRGCNPVLQQDLRRGTDVRSRLSIVLTTNGYSKSEALPGSKRQSNV